LVGGWLKSGLKWAVVVGGGVVKQAQVETNVERVSELTAIVWRDGSPSRESADFGSLKELADAPSLAWIDVRGATADELATMAGQLGLDRQTIEDAITPRERAKAIRFDGYSFATVYGAALSRASGVHRRVRLAHIGVYTLPTCLLTIRRDNQFDMAPVVDRWQADPRLAQFGVDGLLQGLLDVAVDQQFEVLQGIDDDAEAVIAKMFVDNPNLKGLQQQTFYLRRELVELRRVIPPMRDVIAQLIRAGEADRAWTAELISYYEDLNDHALRATEWLDSLRDLVSSIFETSLALNDNRMNQVMKKLAGWAAIIAVPTLITGYFGMNVPYFGFSDTAGFIASTALIVVAAVTLFIVMRRKDWI